MKLNIRTMFFLGYLSLGVFFNAVGVGKPDSGLLYTIIPTTVGDNAVVDAIKQHSDITEHDVNRWKPFGLWFVGASIGMWVEGKIRNYIDVCKSIELADKAFQDESSLRALFPINWSMQGICIALKNLKDQGLNALALVAQLATSSTAGVRQKSLISQWQSEIANHIKNIDHNRELLKNTCTELMKREREKIAESIKFETDMVKLDELRSKAVSARMGIVTNIGGYALKNAAELIKEGITNSGPTTLLGISLYLAKEMGLFKPSVSTPTTTQGGKS